MKRTSILIVLLVVIFSISSTMISLSDSVCPTGEIELVLNLNNCQTGTYTCCLYKIGNSNSLGCMNITFPTENKANAVGNYCIGFYYWVVSSPANFTTCYSFYDPQNPQLTFYSNCSDCSSDKFKK